MKTVCFDVDTQIDFLYPAGALYVPGAEAIVDRVDAHTEEDPKTWPAQCVARTAGRQKAGLNQRVRVGAAK